VEFDYQDLEYCLATNWFDFAMPVNKQDGRLIIRNASKENVTLGVSLPILAD